MRTLNHGGPTPPPQELRMSHRICISLIAVMFLTSAALAADEVAVGAPNLIGKDFTGWKLKNPPASLWKVAGEVKMSEKNNKELEPSGEPGATPLLVNDLKVGQHGT